MTIANFEKIRKDSLVEQFSALGIGKIALVKDPDWGQRKHYSKPQYLGHGRYSVITYTDSGQYIARIQHFTDLESADAERAYLKLIEGMAENAAKRRASDEEKDNNFIHAPALYYSNYPKSQIRAQVIFPNGRRVMMVSLKTSSDILTVGYDEHGEYIASTVQRRRIEDSDKAVEDFLYLRKNRQRRIEDGDKTVADQTSHGLSIPDNVQDIDPKQVLLRYEVGGKTIVMLREIGSDQQRAVCVYDDNKGLLFGSKYDLRDGDDFRERAFDRYNRKKCAIYIDHALSDKAFFQNLACFTNEDAPGGLVMSCQPIENNLCAKVVLARGKDAFNDTVVMHVGLFMINGKTVPGSVYKYPIYHVGDQDRAWQKYYQLRVDKKKSESSETNPIDIDTELLSLDPERIKARYIYDDDGDGVRRDLILYQDTDGKYTIANFDCNGACTDCSERYSKEAAWSFFEIKRGIFHQVPKIYEGMNIAAISPSKILGRYVDQSEMLVLVQCENSYSVARCKLKICVEVANHPRSFDGLRGAWKIFHSAVNEMMGQVAELDLGSIPKSKRRNNRPVFAMTIACMVLAVVSTIGIVSLLGHNFYTTIALILSAIVGYIGFIVGIENYRSSWNQRDRRNEQIYHGQ